MVPINFLLDENLPSDLIQTAVRHNDRNPQYAIRVLQVGDEGAPPRGTRDPQLLSWCETHASLLVTFDKRSMPAHLNDHLAAGKHCPGVLIVRPTVTLHQIVEFLAAAAYAAAADEWRDRYEWIP